MKGLVPPFLWNRPVASIGLDLFFSLSGYLIYDSWLRDPRLGPFVLKRALRIFPGLVVCVLFCIAIGAVATTLPLEDYLRHHATWQFLLNAALYLKLYLPGVFSHRLLGGAVNGSLWSLFPEMLCYLAVPLVWLAAAWGRGALLLAIMGACGAGGLYMFAYHPTGYSLIYSADPKFVLVQVPFFMAGAFWRQLEMRMPALFRLDAAVLLCALTFLSPLLPGNAGAPVRWLTLSYTVIAFGRQSTPLLHYSTRFGDLSYGAYLYAFPIQQLVLDHTRGFAITLATALTFAVALVSWHLVERPALKLKPSYGRRPETALGLASTVAAAVRAPSGGPDWRGWGRSALGLAGDIPVLPAVAALLCLAVYAGQIGLGHWQSDEYVRFADLGAQGWGAVLPRLAASPWPFSEALLSLYGAAVLMARSPLIAPFLAILWAAVLACTSLAAWGALPPSHRRLWTAGALAWTLFAFVLVTNRITEVFYWPAAAAALLPTAASAVALMFLVSRPLDGRRRLGCGAALLVAAGSGDAGAAMAVGFAGAAVLSGALGGKAGLMRTLRGGTWWIGPAALGATGLVVVAMGRAHAAGPDAGAFPLGHAAASLRAGLRGAAMVFAGGGARTDAPAFAMWLLFIAGFAAVWDRADPAATLNRWHAVWAAGLATAALYSLAVTGQDAASCCEGVGTIRAWMLDLIAVVAFRWAFARWRAWRRVGFLAPGLLALSLLAIIPDVPGLRADYANAGWATASVARTWRSAARPGTDRMEFYMPPDAAGMLIHGDTQPVGEYRVGPEAPDQIRAVGRFFGKAVVVRCQPWQTEQSWLIDGEFIAACPPHGGPPDRILPDPDAAAR